MRVLARRDRFDRFMSVLVYVPRDRASERCDRGDRRISGRHLQGHVSAGFSLFFPEGPLVRVHFIIARSAEPIDDPDRATLEYGVGAIVRTWTDALSEAAGARPRSAASPSNCSSAIRQAFSAELSRPLFAGDGARRHPHHRRPVVAERRSRRILRSGPRRAEAHRPEGLELRAAPSRSPSRVPILENMGFRVVDERTYDISPATQNDTQRLAARHDAGARRRQADRHRAVEAGAGKLLPGGDARRRRE